MTTDTFSLAGHSVRRVGFGAMQLPGPGVFGPPRDHDEAVRVLQRAVELGVNHIDTSQFYGPNVSNELIHEALHPYSDDLVLVSKVGARRDDKGGWLPAQHPDQLRSAVHENLQTLGVDRLPVVNLRVMPRAEMAEGDYCPLEDQLAAMQELVDEGALEAFGASNVTAEQAATAIEAGAVCIQNAYNLLHRDDDATLGLCRERGVAYVPFFPLGSAFPDMPKVTENATVQAVAERRGVTPSQVGLAWLLDRADNILLIPGTSSVAHLEENTAVGEVRLEPADLQELNGLG
ncbi:oxidoreductase [Luteipulveratus sp. YIM 133132]|uniref:Oxidoreductase n=1 Tax=Luteipulveratus flavus TaxID=3031728 RepID=A0ABT6CBY7_9MICO|nr:MULTISPECIES: oxidoreductase [unclassified Luteipulveratus]MDE9366380.1 oxidoreductase [Luteipulveratus sp. YIM 133132]MDF8266008.1 oxidoreductase [Luteipulveratus sp. YIM 133296]